MKELPEAPEIHVGILRREQIEINFPQPFRCAWQEGSAKEGSGGEVKILGPLSASLQDGLIELRQEGKLIAAGGEVIFSPGDIAGTGFGILNVLIGIGFHWEQKEDQYFPGILKLVLSEGEIQAINLVSVEDYLACVISSEMRGDASPALLMAHTIISRSWLLAQIEKSNKLLLSDSLQESIYETEDSFIRWYDREDHQNFHVCADDHCQRYQGITRARNPEVVKAVDATRGELLTYENEICDARFSKCCGGVSEEFQSCWEDLPHPYLKRVDDNPGDAGINVDDLKVEAHAERFISGTPKAFCNTRDSALLKQVLNDYDQTSADFYRWEVEYSQDEISSLIREKSGKDFGRILDLLPVERGESGRLIKLKIVGEKMSLIVGKELEIRRCLSPSHLYSSAFIVKKLQLKAGIPGAFQLRGAGWGHGVGLCQIGAAVMAHRGYSHKAILNHYFKHAEIKKLYE